MPKTREFTIAKRVQIYNRWINDESLKTIATDSGI